MKIHKNTDEHFLAELSKQDIKSYQLDFDSIDLSNDSTREMISDLLCSSKLNVDSSDPKHKLNINLIEHKDGSALILITLVKKKLYRLNSKTDRGNGIIVFFNKTTELLKLCEMLSALSGKTVLRLMSDGKKFALEINNCSLDKNNLKAVCLEYGDSIEYDETLCAQIREHYSLVCDNVTAKLLP